MKNALPRQQKVAEAHCLRPPSRLVPTHPCEPSRACAAAHFVHSQEFSSPAGTKHKDGDDAKSFSEGLSLTVRAAVMVSYMPRMVPVSGPSGSTSLLSRLRPKSRLVFKHFFKL